MGSPRGGDTAGDEGGGGGEEGDRERWLGSSFRSREHRRSASDFVMRPHCAAEMGSTRASLRDASWPGLQVEQKICSSSQAWNKIEILLICYNFCEHHKHKSQSSKHL